MYSLTFSVEPQDITMEQVESISQSESGRVVICRCSKALIYANKECLASNHGNLCAQSDAGGNINCNGYSSNCGGE